MNSEKLAVILDDLINGRGREMVKKIEDYGLYNFWADYREYLAGVSTDKNVQHGYFTSTTISYFKIKNSQ